MGGVAVLNPHDVLTHGFSYNRMPLISTSPSTSKDSNPNPKTVSSPNRRRRSPQKKTNDLSRISSPKNTNVLPRFTDGPSLEMGKVTILRRGQVMDDDEKKEKKKEKKTVSFGKENKIEKEKKSELFDKNKKKKKKEKEKKRLVFDKKIVKEEKMDLLLENEDVKRIEDPESVSMLLMRLGPEPGMVPGFYAGSGFVDSPSPRLVPLPSFLAEETKDDYGHAHASSYLRSLLKLGF